MLTLSLRWLRLLTLLGSSRFRWIIVLILFRLFMRRVLRMIWNRRRWKFRGRRGLVVLLARLSMRRLMRVFGRDGFNGLFVWRGYVRLVVVGVIRIFVWRLLWLVLILVGLVVYIRCWLCWLFYCRRVLLGRECSSVAVLIGMRYSF